MRRALVPVLVAVLAATACSSSLAMRAAENGDYSALRGEVRAREARGDLSNGDAACLAKAVASHEILAAKTPDDALARIGDASSCAKELDDALATRAKTADAAGAAAALARYETGELDDDDARAHASDADPAWRAVGARALTRVKDRTARAIALRDPDARVRRRAARAAADAQDPADLEPLAEMARLDPEPIVRTEAVRAMAALPPDAAVVQRLQDLWTNGDDELREDIAIAWAAPGLFERGGRDVLRLVIGSGKDAAGVVEAAAAVELLGTSDKALGDEASAAILRVMKDGSRRARLHALAVARPEHDAETLAALDAAARDDGDPEVKVAALARLLEVAPRRAAAQAALEAIAKGPAEDAVASRARFALASAGDAAVAPILERDLDAKDPYAKLGAASGLAALGRAGRAAPLLADSDAMVRTRAACTLLMAARVHK